MKTLIEIHLLQNFAPSNLNRDDTGAPKDAFFGGTRRARVSSQCWKRAVRERFSAQSQRWGFRNEDLAKRTKRLAQELMDKLKQRGRESAELESKVTSALAAVGFTLKRDKSDQTLKAQYLMFLGDSELTALAELIDQQWDSISLVADENEGEDKSSGKKDKKSAVPKELKKAVEKVLKVLSEPKAADLALFGRMLADMPKANQEASCQVAHAISTHAVEREFDFYTAIDDLQPEDSSGADMMGTVEFNSACFYRYAVTDWEQLQKNLQGDQDLARRTLLAFLESFVCAEPTGKQNSFAAHNPAEFVAITVRRNGAPRSLANAFESAVMAKRSESLTAQSAQKLMAKAVQLQAAYGGEATTWVLNLTSCEVQPDFGEKKSSVEELIQVAVAAVVE